MQTTKLFMGLYPMTQEQAKLALKSAESAQKLMYYKSPENTAEINELKKFISNF
jgi:hypothetical protein